MVSPLLLRNRSRDHVGGVYVFIHILDFVRGGDEDRVRNQCPFADTPNAPKANYEHVNRAHNLELYTAQNDSAEGEERPRRPSTHEDQVKSCV